MTSVLKVDNIQNSSGTDAISIDSNGVVTKSVIPAFRVGLNGDQVETSSGTNIVVEWNDLSTDNCFVQGGMSFSSGVVTVPVAGIYQFNLVLRIDDIGTGYAVAKVVVNNDESQSRELYIMNGDPATNYDNYTGGDILKLSANDNVRVTVFASSDTSWDVHNASHFSGALIG